MRNRELELPLRSDTSISYTQGSYEKQLSKRKKTKGLVEVQDGCWSELFFLFVLILTNLMH